MDEKKVEIKPVQKKKTIDDFVIVSTPIFKLKDRPKERQSQLIHIEKMFGAVPELIAVQKVQGSNNKIMVKAFIPKDQMTEKETPKIKVKKEDIGLPKGGEKSGEKNK